MRLADGRSCENLRLDPLDFLRYWERMERTQEESKAEIQAWLDARHAWAQDARAEMERQAEADGQ